MYGEPGANLLCAFVDPPTFKLGKQWFAVFRQVKSCRASGQQCPPIAQAQWIFRALAACWTLGSVRIFILAFGSWIKGTLLVDVSLESFQIDRRPRL